MILDQISYLDCIVFLLFLIPQLLIHVGIWRTVIWLLPTLPSITIFILTSTQVLGIPYRFIRERYLTPPARRSPFVLQATVFQDIVIRCVRYAFSFMPACIGRVFFSRAVALPFLRFRMLRHGMLTSPLKWHEVHHAGLHGLWITSNQSEQPDVVVYYCHGGGFSMGSSYFYLEFLLAWVTLLKEAGYKNPALFTLEYTLVPDAVYPTQLQQTLAGYEHVLSVAKDPSRICIGGDSAGATLSLSFLLYITEHPELRGQLPGMAVMISPWVSLVSPLNRNTSSDYLNADSLERYGRQYCGSKVPVDDPLVSPGQCKDVQKWKAATPRHGWFFTFGAEEVLAPATRELVSLLKAASINVEAYEETAGIHAWPVASLYLGQTADERLGGLRIIVRAVRHRIPSAIQYPVSVSKTPKKVSVTCREGPVSKQLKTR
ncbi:alpha/beta-hydrolase [Delitschia confertaspora ATCC 74209]|uniref:Alpha/beta-hydrolase n=1 Tax=Delitschia confertaspora ATCC 74209 TaxID=1513339 RepID=A0A9P4MSU0_9PLEO|nr:alpha/beta-hydrolase [Delitschia confertaspora ATCC 74209]